MAILVEFPDMKHAVNKTTIDDLIFHQMANYYYNVSYGEIQVVGKSIGWYQLPNPMPFYGADLNPSQSGTDANPVQLIRDAITAAEPDIDFNAYSKIIVIHAGGGQEDAVSTSNDIWSEAYWYDLQIKANNGAIVNAAAIGPNWRHELAIRTNEHYVWSGEARGPEKCVGYLCTRHCCLFSS